MKKTSQGQVKITGGFWQKRQELVKDVTTMAVYNRFYETGRIDAFKCDKNPKYEPHIYWDSDVAKWIEGVAYIVGKQRDERLEALVDKIVDEIEKNQEECGYFNSYYLVREYENRFKNRDCHELYCAGHLIEAAVAYYYATGKKKFLDIMCKFADYIELRFKINRDTGFVTPGHEEIELALVKLYEATGKKRYIELSKFFVDERGKNDEALTDWCNGRYHQSYVPVREQREAEGHAVRATYLYSAMADLALRYDDKELFDCCEAIFDDIINGKMYITGGIGSSSAGESFTIPYDLPNIIAYTESCAAIGLVFFAHRMLLLTNDAKYSSVIERALYNGFLSSFSLDGKSFFYTNPLEINPELLKRDMGVTHKSLNLPITQRKEVFDCSCCPPNIVRFVSSLENYIYTSDDSTIYVHQYMNSEGSFNINGKEVKIEQKTAYPENGKVTVKISGADARVLVRIPDFSDTYKGKMEKGYAVFNMKDGEEISLDFDMTPHLVEADPRVYIDCGKVAVQRGPIVYCMEGADNGENIRDIRIDKYTDFKEIYDSNLDDITIEVKAYRRLKGSALYSKFTSEREKITARLIPYYAFANRGETEMHVWCLCE